jgi:hypothetical protein
MMSTVRFIRVSHRKGNNNSVKICFVLSYGYAV